MRHDQGTGPNSPYWSTAADDGGQDWIAPLQDYIRNALQDLPSWVPVAAAGLVLVGLVVAGVLSFSSSSKKRAALDEKHAAAVAEAKEKGQPLPPAPLHMNTKPLLGGFAVSLNGLWGFAQDQLDLSFFFAIGFISMFDILELYVFSEMFRLANEDPRRRWTRALKWLRFSAWLIVIIAAAANAAHAPSIQAAPFLAIMPILAAWLLYVPLHSALGTPEEEDERPEGAKPGPLLLAGLVWRKMWAFLFGLFGLDVADRADEMVRRARAREAADASYALRKALHRRDQLADEVAGPSLRKDKKAKEKELKALERELEFKIRPKAQAALELADTQDAKQGLQLMQRMAWLTRADDVALLDYGPESPAMRVLEELNIASNADFIESSQRAREEDQRAADAQKRAEEAVKALTDAENRLAELGGKLEELDKAQERETNRLRVVTEERAHLEKSGSSAQQLYQRTVGELENERGKVADLEGERRRLTNTLSAIQSQLASLEGDYKALQTEVNGLAEERDRLAGEKSLADARAKSASEEMVRLQSRLELFEEMAAEETAGRLVGAVPAARGTGGGTSVEARIDTEEGSAGAKIAGFQLLEQQYLALPVDKRVAMSASALARQWWEASGLTEQTTRKYIGDIKKMHDKTQDAADGSAAGQD
ncbi:coiled-coil domain-containing protein [Streptomyces cinereoruber]|uniref:hypothetical protein n=1 Tax=Streptomyces cinereoruber TaxID=67260 RepID=UPI003638C595